MPNINPSTDKCLWSARFRGSNPQDSRCIACFINNTVADNNDASPVTVANVQIEHHFVRGPYVPNICGMCERSFVKEKPISQCPLCREKLTAFLDNLAEQGVPVDETWFMYNVYEDQLVYFRTLL